MTRFCKDCMVFLLDSPTQYINFVQVQVDTHTHTHTQKREEKKGDIRKQNGRDARYQKLSNF
jgi:hypothetical protein